MAVIAVSAIVIHNVFTKALVTNACTKLGDIVFALQAQIGDSCKRAG